jgi:hypothetical protein
VISEPWYEEAHTAGAMVSTLDSFPYTGGSGSTALLRTAMAFRLRDAPDSAEMLTGALRTVCDELHAHGQRAEHLVVTVRVAWADAARGAHLTQQMTGHLYDAILREALVIFFAESQ